jgi:putative phosphoserine phosphatase/1-acylglycerol-3-phosphate O-acyltransferase
MSDLLTVDDAIKAVLTGPSGPHIGAFFDLDGTLVEGYTANTFFTDSIRRRDIAPGDVARSLLSAVDGALGGDRPARCGRHGRQGRGHRAGVGRAAVRAEDRRVGPSAGP